MAQVGGATRLKHVRLTAGRQQFFSADACSFGEEKYVFGAKKREDKYTETKYCFC